MQKRGLFFILLFFFCFQVCYSQNLVSNASFESYSSLPNGYGQLALATGWNNCGGGGTPDYFHRAGTVGLYFGTNLPHTGQAMAGFCPWHGSISNYREYVSSQLISPMTSGIPYTVSFWLANGINGGYGSGCNNIGVLFSSAPLSQPGSGPILSTPQLETTTIFYDTAWTQFTFQFTPSSAFNYITIGNFRNDAATSSAIFGTSYAAVYYFIDDISVTPKTGLPVAHFQSSDTIFCNEGGECIDFTDQSTGSPTNWKWSFPGGVPDTSTQQNPTNICYYVPGTYAVTLIVSNASGTDSLTINPKIIFYEGPPPPPIRISHDTLFFQAYASSYQWYYNGSPIPGATDSFYVTTQGGLYNVYFTDFYGCTRLGTGVDFVSVNELNAEASTIKIYPNPVEDHLTINLGGLLRFTRNDFFDLKIYNVLGEKVLQSEITSPKSGINVDGLAKGIYMVEVIAGEKIYFVKFVKE